MRRALAGILIVVLSVSTTVIIYGRIDNLPVIVSKVIPAVVHIRCLEGWEGSGVIVSSDGIIVTARHVIEGGQTFVITLNDGRKFTTTKACTLRDYDVGYIKVDAVGLSFVESSKSITSLSLGETLFAIGSEFGIEHFNSVTTGILSSRNRNFSNDFPGWSILFQTDTVANPGSSGGPVFDTSGKLVGIVVGGPIMPYAGIVYCVPSDIIIKNLPGAKLIFALKEFNNAEWGPIYSQ